MMPLALSISTYAKPPWLWLEEGSCSIFCRRLDRLVRPFAESRDRNEIDDMNAIVPLYKTLCETHLAKKAFVEGAQPAAIMIVDSMIL